MINRFFVYGTLKRGQCRENMWPATPKSVHPGWVRGRLYARSDYPALRPGDDRVLGEIWEFYPDDVPNVAKTLDAIEVTNQPGIPDLYVRATVRTHPIDGEMTTDAIAYHYARDPDQDGFVRVQPAEQDATVHWPA